MIKIDQVHRLLDKFYTYRFYLLFIGLIINYLVPQFTFFPLINTVVKLFFTTILLLSGANFIEENRKNLRLMWLIFGIILIGLSFFFELTPKNIFLYYSVYFLKYLFFIVITFSLLRQIFAIKEVTFDVIVGSFCGYLLIGIISFFLFMLIDFSTPNALAGLSSNPENRVDEIFYFALTSLTTLGFGDIRASNVFSQKLSVFTAMIGQFYLAVVVAVLISRFIHFENANKNKDKIT